MTRLADNSGGAGGWGGDSHPAQEPQALTDLEADRHRDWNPAEDYQFVYANGQLHVSDDNTHEELAGHAGVKADHAGPMAVGNIHVDMGKAIFEVESNVHAQGMARILKDYAETQGWRWGGMTDAQGEPIGTGSEFAPVKSYIISAGRNRDTVKIAKMTQKYAILNTTDAVLAVHVDEHSAKAYLTRPMDPAMWPGVKEWADDHGLTLVAANDNVLKKIEDLEVNNTYTPEWNAEDDHFMFQDPPDERQPGGVFKCRDCGRIFHSWGVYLQHRQKEEPVQNDAVVEDGKFPELNMDATFPPNVSEPMKDWTSKVASAYQPSQLLEQTPDSSSQIWSHAYQITPPEHREAILRDGLQPTFDWEGGRKTNWFFPNVGDFQAYYKGHPETLGWDLWRVNHPYTYQFGHGIYHDQVVPPEHIELLDPTKPPYSAADHHGFKTNPFEGTYSGKVSKVATETLPQEIRRWDELNRSLSEAHQPQSQVVHEWPDGWTVQQHTTARDIQRVGQMMRNCWQGAAPRPGTSGRYHSLHDEHGIPRVAFYWDRVPGDAGPDDPARALQEPLAARNHPPEPHHLDRLYEFAMANSSDPRILETLHGGYQELTPERLHAMNHRPLPLPERFRGQIGEPRNAGTDPKDMIPGPLPFLYDIQEDQIVVGHPGQRHSDIPGKFTPGGMVEGTYEPGGKVLIRSMTNMPYTVRHMLELWYWQHPHMEIKSINLLDDAGGKTKLASQEIHAHIPEIERIANEVEWIGDPRQRGSEAHGRWHDAWCDATAEQVSKYLQAQSFPHTLASASHHSWIELLDGTIVDPTIRQFRGSIKSWPGTENTAIIPAEHPLAQHDIYRGDDYVSRFMPRLANDGQDIGGYINSLVAADPGVWRAARAMMDAGGKVFCVGGAVRDALLGKEPKDIDLMVTGLPADMVRHVLGTLPGRVDLTGKDFGVFRYKEGQSEVEIALPRRERSTGTGHQDFDVQADHTMTPEEDLFRRDFTMNAMAVDLSDGKLLDPFHGSDDLKTHTLRTLNTKSLSDDPLRTIRALVAMSKHGVTPNKETKEQMSENAHLISHLPAERIQAELDKLFAGKYPAKAIQMAADTGVLEHFLPEVARTVGHSQNNPHHELHLFDHLVNVLDRAKERKPDDPDFALAALLHDIGKYDSHWTECRDCGWKAHGPFDTCHACGSNNTSGHFYALEPGIGADHETVGAEQADALMRRLKYPTKRIDRVVSLVQGHMFPGFKSEKGARRFLNRHGEHADDLLDLRWADQGGKSAYPTDPSLTVDGHRDLLEKVRAAGAPTNQRSLAINGRDLLALGIPQGPQVGQVLEQLTQAVVDNPALNTREALEGMVRGMQ